MYRIITYIIVTFFIFSFQIKAQVITTVAGNRTGGYSGDGGAATLAAIGTVADIETDRAGNIYFVDDGTHTLRKITTSGIITTIAGTGSPGSGGDGGPATAAELDRPSGLAFDSLGNIYIADQDNFRIRKISTSGIITNFAGTGTAGYAGDMGPATSASFSGLKDIECDRYGNLYAIDRYRIRKIDTFGVITTIAGNDTPGYRGDGSASISALLDDPTGLAIDLRGNIYESDYQNFRIRKIDPAGIIHTIAGTGSMGFTGDGGPATAAEIYPSSITCDSIGNVYMLQAAYTCKIRKINTAGIISSVAGGGAVWGEGGPATAALIDAPNGITIDKSGNIYFGEFYQFVIRKIDTCQVPFILNISGPSVACIGSTASFSDSTSGGVWSSSVTSVATINSTTGLLYALTGGTDTVIYSVTNSCATASVTLPITTEPNPGWIDGCRGTAVGRGFWFHNYASTAGYYSSSNPAIASIDSFSGLVTATSSGTCIISYTVSNSCGTASDTFLLQVLPVNSPPILGDTIVCIGESVNFINSIPGGMWWCSPSKGTINSSGLFTATATGPCVIDYNLGYNYCYIGITLNINIIDDSTCSTSLYPDLLSTAPYVTIYPNPSVGEFNILPSSGRNETVRIVIKDLFGKVVADIEQEAGKSHQFNKQFTPGMYVVHCYFQGVTVIDRFIVE